MHLLLDPLLVEQHGIVTRRQALGAACSRNEIDRLLKQGLLVAQHRGVLRDPAAPCTTEQRAMAAVLAGGDGAFASHRMAVALRGMRNYRCDLAEITTVRTIERGGLRAHKTRSVIEPTKLRGIPTSSPARTLVDCTSVLSTPTVARFAETWLSTAVVSFEDLDAEMRLWRNHIGVAALRRILDGRDLGRSEPDSPAEGDLARLLIRHGFPAPTLHHVVTIGAGLTFELDWSYPDISVAFELDGYGIHLRSLDAFEHDRFRGNELTIEGWHVLQFSKRQLTRSPKTVLSQVERAVAANTPRRVDLP